MNQANTGDHRSPTGPVEMVAQVQANLAYIEGLTRHRDFSREALKKTVQDTRFLLNLLSVQLQQRALT